MPERSFGRTVRYRRTKLGLSQSQLADLVGRSPSTVRSWESDRSTPNEPKVLFTLAAILGIDERTLFDKAGVERPAIVETSPTIEQALATLAPPTGTTPEPEPRRMPRTETAREPETQAAVAEPGRATTTLTAVPVQELSYVEDPVQRQVYRVRTLAALVALVAMAIALIWAVSQGLDGLGRWWSDLFSQFRL